MDLYFISDLHFNHKNIIEYEKRPFANVEEMNAALIENWNKTITNEDVVYVVGDFVLGYSETVLPILNRLNGKQFILIRGNHDTSLKCSLYDSHPKVILKDADAIITSIGKHSVFCPITHLPLLPRPDSGSFEFTFPIHGHTHAADPFFHPETHCFNVSADVIDFTPVSFETIKQIIRDQIAKEKVDASNRNSKNS